MMLMKVHMGAMFVVTFGRSANLMLAVTLVVVVDARRNGAGEGRGG